MASIAFYFLGGIVNLGTRLSFGQLKKGSSTPTLILNLLHSVGSGKWLRVTKCPIPNLK